MSRWLKCTAVPFNTDWNKYDERLMKGVERGEVDKVAAVLAKKGIIPTKLDLEGRSAFHLAATRGHLDCLNLILGHNVDITATDATGKNALHLAARNGHSLCVQKLLQHNCPVGNVDLQGRTALHDAVMAGCSSSVKLLCDSGAAVNATDFDGRTPLVLATQMCHPRLCQLLLERGADFTITDKQNKTALILGCEYSCKDAVEVLLKSGADLKPVDTFGHDAFHYARLSKNSELLMLVKSGMERQSKEKEAARIEQWKRQHSMERADIVEINRRDQIIHDLERQNESLQESLKRSHQEQRGLLDQVSLLQQQLTQEKVDESIKEKDLLKVSKDDSSRGLDTVKVQLRTPMGDYSGQSVIKGKETLVKPAHSLDSEQVQRVSVSRSLSRGSDRAGAGVSWDRPSGLDSLLPSDLDSLHHELDLLRRKQQTGEEEALRLQSALSRKNRELQDVIQGRDLERKQAEQQIQELEDALGDVQKRMLDSECKVKQLQAHVVAVKEHLGAQVNEDLRAQLQEVKAKYEGASAEVGRVRNRLKQSEKALEEYKTSEAQLSLETETVQQQLRDTAAELRDVTAQRDHLTERTLQLEGQLRDRTKPGNTVPAEKFDNMKNLLTNAVDEKERQLAELREDYDRVLEEVAELHRKVDGPPQGSQDPQEQLEVQAALEEQNQSLKKRLLEVTAKSQALIQEVEESEEERDLLRDQLDKLSCRLETDFVPAAQHEEARQQMVRALEDLEDKLVEAGERYGRAEAQVQQLQSDLAELQTRGEKQSSRVDQLSAHNENLTEQLESLQRRFQNRDQECVQLSAQSQALQKSLDGDYVPRRLMEQTAAELTATIGALRSTVSELESTKSKDREEFQKVTEGKEKLKVELERVRLEMSEGYVSLSEHNAVADGLRNTAVEAENRANKASEMLVSAREETVRLTQELEAQKRELDTIQEAIQSKFIPKKVLEEKEQANEKQLKELKQKLQETEEKYNLEKSSGEVVQQEREQLRAQMESAHQRLDLEKQRELEEEYKNKFQELSIKLQDLEKQRDDAKRQKAEVDQENANSRAQAENLQERLKSELTRIATYDNELKALQETVQQAQADCKKARAAQQDEAQKVCVLQQRREEQQQKQESLKTEVETLKLSLKEEEENNAQRTEDIAALQSELLQATQALEKLRHKDENINQLQKDKQNLTDEVSGLRQKLLLLSDEVQDAREDAALSREQERKARTETSAVQEKGRTIEKEVRELKERYDQSLSTIGELQKRIQSSAQQTEAKDKKISELLTDVDRLKQALNGLSQLAYANPNKRSSTESLQNQVKSLQQQLADAERQHREVVSIYRTHLLSAAQGHMDEDVQAALLQIIRMRQEFVC